MPTRTASIIVLSVVVMTLPGCRTSSGGSSGGYPTVTPVSVATPSDWSPSPTPPSEPSSSLAKGDPTATPARETASPKPATETFDSPEAAMGAVATIAETHDHDRAFRVFGADCDDLVGSKDEPADDEDCKRVAAMIREKTAFEERASMTVALLGEDRWEFPIPLVATNGRWAFDVTEGRNRLRTLEIGRNELLTAQALEEYSEAQHEFAATSRPGAPRSFATAISSTEGKRDGLHWKTDDGATDHSHLGPLMAGAAFDEARAAGVAAVPFNGYFFKALKGQGKAAPGGARAYANDDGHLVHGCGAIAWPAEYGETGVMTFMVSHAGIVYEKDLGSATAEAARTIDAFTPDETWTPSTHDE